MTAAVTCFFGGAIIGCDALRSNAFSGHGVADIAAAHKKVGQSNTHEVRETRHAHTAEAGVAIAIFGRFAGTIYASAIIRIGATVDGAGACCADFAFAAFGIGCAVAASTFYGVADFTVGITFGLSFTEGIATVRDEASVAAAGLAVGAVA